jgi:NAD+ diphosphatase
LNDNSPAGAYLFQGNTLVVPGERPDSLICEAVSEEKIKDSFDTSDTAEFFETPAVGGSGGIRSVLLEPKTVLPAQWRSIPMRQAVSLMTNGATADGTGPVGRILRAYHIVQWRRDSVFCGSCGSRNGDAQGELARLCPACGRLEFPRISPAVIVIIINGKGQALLAHNNRFAGGVYSLIAGFNEAGESLESTVAREIREEVALEVKNIRYVVSQPWPFPNSLMLGFTAAYAGGTVKPDGVEIEDARWFDKHKLPDLPGYGSVSRFLINSWIRGKL